MFIFLCLLPFGEIKLNIISSGRGIYAPLITLFFGILIHKGVKFNFLTFYTKLCEMERPRGIRKRCQIFHVKSKWRFQNAGVLTISGGAVKEVDNIV